MPLHFTKTSNGKTRAWDDGSTYDRRVARLSTLLTKTTQQDVIELFKSIEKLRGREVTMALGSSDTSFYPFGPDKGDVGNFVMFAQNIKASGIMQQPWEHMLTEWEFLGKTFPSYSLPSTTGFSQGDFYVGTVTGLLHPQEGYEVSNELAYTFTATGASAVTYTDIGYTSDSHTATLTVQCNHQKAAQLVNYLCTTVRGGTFLLKNSGNMLPFGGYFRDSLAELSVRLSSGTISMSCSGDQWRISLQIAYETWV
jgi:hypothetical protein